MILLPFTTLVSTQASSQLAARTSINNHIISAWHSCWPHFNDSIWISCTLLSRVSPRSSALLKSTMSTGPARHRSPSRASVASEVDVSTSGAGFTSIDERYHFGAQPLATRHRSRTVHAWHGEQAHFQVLIPLPDTYSKPLTLKVEVSDFFEPDTSDPAFSALECVKLFVVKPVRADMQVVYDRLEPLPLAPRRSKDGSYIDALSAEVPLPADGLVPGNSDPWLLPVPWVPGRTGRRGRLRDNTTSDRFVLLWGYVHAPTHALSPSTYSFQRAASEASAASASPAAGLLPTYSCTLRLTFESSEPIVSPPPGSLQSGVGATATPPGSVMSLPFPGSSPAPPPRGSAIAAAQSPALATSALALDSTVTPTSMAAAVATPTATVAPTSTAPPMSALAGVGGGQMGLQGPGSHTPLLGQAAATQVVGPVYISLAADVVDSISTYPQVVDTTELTLHLTTPLPIPGPGETPPAYGVLPPPLQHDTQLHLWQNPFAIAEYHRVPLWSPAHWALLRQNYALLAESGGSSVTATVMHDPWGSQTHTPYASMVKWVLTTDDTGASALTFDFSVFDAWVTLCLDLGMGPLINCYSILPWAPDGGGSEAKAAMPSQYALYNATAQRLQRMWAHPLQPTYKAMWTAFLTAFHAHLHQMGWLGITAVGVDERPPEEMREAIALVRSVAPGLRIALAGNYHQELEDCVDDWCVWLRNPLPTPAVMPLRNSTTPPSAQHAHVIIQEEGTASPSRGGHSPLDNHGSPFGTPTASEGHAFSGLRSTSDVAGRERGSSIAVEPEQGAGVYTPSLARGGSVDDAGPHGEATRNTQRFGCPSMHIPVAIPEPKRGIPRRMEAVAAALCGRRTTTYYTCCGPVSPNTFTGSPPVESAWLGLYGEANGYDGYLRWAYDCWGAEPTVDTRYRPRFWRAGDCYLAYPNAQPSVRLQLLRHGLVMAEKQRITAHAMLQALADMGAAPSAAQPFSYSGLSACLRGGQGPFPPPSLGLLTQQSSSLDVSLVPEGQSAPEAAIVGAAIPLQPPPAAVKAPRVVTPQPPPAPQAVWRSVVENHVEPQLGGRGTALMRAVNTAACAGEHRPGGFTVYDCLRDASFNALHGVLAAKEATPQLWLAVALAVLRGRQREDFGAWPLPSWPSDTLAEDETGVFAKLLESKRVPDWTEHDMKQVHAQAQKHAGLAPFLKWVAPHHLKPSDLFGPVLHLPPIATLHDAEKSVSVEVAEEEEVGMQSPFLPRVAHPAVSKAVHAARTWQLVVDLILATLLEQARSQ